MRTPLLARKREWIAVGLAVSLVLGFYVWTASTTDGLPPWPMGKDSYGDHYNLLVHGILKGHLYLDTPVDPAMLSARNPYDPSVWVPHGWMIDASYYRGHYYVYYGIVPVLVFMLPFRLLTGGDLWLGTGAESVTILAFLALACLWLRIRRDYFPRTGSVILFSSMLALGTATGLLALARRPSMYEFAIGSGCFFATLMLHSLCSALSSERRAIWMAAAGVFLGLAVGCRPPLLVTILAPAWILWTFLRKEQRQPLPRGALRPSATGALAFAAGFGTILSGLLAYNYLRFGNIFEFGFYYLLQDPKADLAHIWSPSNFWFNLRLYYTGALEWSRTFPFASLGPRPAVPRHYYTSDDIFGILKYAPMVWFALASPLALRRRAGADPGRYGVVLAMMGLAYLGPGICDLFFGGSAVRYMVDFLPALALVSFFGACALDQAVSAPWARRLVRAVWLSAAVISAAVAAILSIPLEGCLLVHRGNEYYLRVARVLNEPTFWYERARGWHYGPITWQLSFPARPPHTVEKLAETPGALLLVEYLPGSRIRLGLGCSGENVLLWGEGAEITPGRVQTLSASFGSLYPAAEHPYYLKHPFDVLNGSTIRAVLGDRPALEGFHFLEPADCGDIRIADGRSGPGWFSGRVLAVARNGLSARDVSADFGARTIRLVVPDAQAPGAWPLISAGSAAGGDLLTLETGPAATARFGYYSTGSPALHGPAFRLRPGSTLEVTVQMEQLAPSGRLPGGLRPLVVEVGNRIRWMTRAPYHPCESSAIRVGVNGVAQSSVEDRCPGPIRWVETPPRLYPSTDTDHLLMRVVFSANARWGLRDPILFTGDADSFDGISVVHYGGGRGRFVLNHRGVADREAPILDSLDGRSVHDIEIETPVFRLYGGASGQARGTLVVRMDGSEVLRFDSVLHPAALTEATVGGAVGEGPTERLFSGAILSRRWVGALER